MKKVLSVLLAAAMVMGMSVSAMAKPGTSTTTTVGFGTTSAKASDVSASAVNFDYMYIQRGNSFVANDGESTLLNPNFTEAAKAPVGLTGLSAVQHGSAYADDTAIQAGDILYFTLTGTNADYVPKNWKVKLSDNTYIDSASLVVIDGTDEGKDTPINNLLYWCQNGYKKVAVKLVVSEDFDTYTTDDVKTYFYINDSTSNETSDKVKVTLAFANYKVVELDKDDLDWVITNNGATTYKYTSNTSKAAVIDFGGYFAEFKMYKNEKYTVDADIKYNSALSKEYDCDVEEINFRLDNVVNADLFFVSAKDNKQIVAVVDGELIPVESTFETAHKFNNGSTAKGYLVEDAEYSVYAMIDADVEIEAEEEVEAPVVEADKANPETGAADFVGAAVAMAVVSVAAAGALALKK